MKKIKCIDINKDFESSYHAARYLNNEKFGNTKKVKNIACKIRDCVLGNRKSAYGFKWEIY